MSGAGGASERVVPGAGAKKISEGTTRREKAMSAFTETVLEDAGKTTPSEESCKELSGIADMALMFGEGWDKLFLTGDHRSTLYMRASYRDFDGGLMQGRLSNVALRHGAVRRLSKDDGRHSPNDTATDKLGGARPELFQTRRVTACLFPSRMRPSSTTIVCSMGSPLAEPGGMSEEAKY